jgi:hypothetical protein
VVMPHWESHPDFGGKVLQSQVGCVWPIGVGVGVGVGVGWG